jgi:glycosyltransferase involved in cell wall biosynthesis
LLVPPRDYVALGEAIGRLLDDPAERERLGDAARRRQQAEFRFEHTLGLLEALYERLYAGAGAGDAMSY